MTDFRGKPIEGFYANLRHSDSGKRWEAMGDLDSIDLDRTLGDAYRSRTIRALCDTIVNDRDQFVRLQATTMVGNIGFRHGGAEQTLTILSPAVPALRAALRDRYSMVGEMAQRILDDIEQIRRSR